MLARGSDELRAAEAQGESPPEKTRSLLECASAAVELCRELKMRQRESEDHSKRDAPAGRRRPGGLAEPGRLRSEGRLANPPRTRKKNRGKKLRIKTDKAAGEFS